MGFVVEKAALKQVFSDHFDFPCQFAFHHTFHTCLSPGTDTIGQLVADVPSELTPTPLKKKKTYMSSSFPESTAHLSFSMELWNLKYHCSQVSICRRSAVS
jgi:hypothetical protein